MRLAGISLLSIAENFRQGGKVFERAVRKDFVALKCGKRIFQCVELVANVKERSVGHFARAVRRGDRNLRHRAEAVSAVAADGKERAEIFFLRAFHRFDHVKIGIAEFFLVCIVPCVFAARQRVVASLKGNGIIEGGNENASVPENADARVAVIQRCVDQNRGGRPGHPLVAAIGGDCLAKGTNVL